MKTLNPLGFGARAARSFDMIAKYLLAALLAGLVAALLVTGAQLVKVVPLIIAAEHYESAPDHSHAESGEAASPATHSHPVVTDDESGRLFGVNRITGTFMANVMTGCGFGLLLAAAVLLTDQRLTLMKGALWGIAGWLAFQFLPGLGMPPELPGMPAANLEDRQIWWFATVIVSSIGLYSLLLRREILAKILGLTLLAIPHVIGAPKPPLGGSNVPAMLAADYVIAALATGLFFWLVLGSTLGLLFDKFARSSE